ncbi:hypothetical protein Hanom_Chr00s002383g01698411 [Helianthus anomalus]
MPISGATLTGMLSMPMVKLTPSILTVSPRFKPLSVASAEQPLMTVENFEVDLTVKRGRLETEVERFSLKDYLEQSRELLMTSDGGPPRWFSPLECGSRLDNSPLLLSLPGSLTFFIFFKVDFN